eukprot:TRINITY_DN16488_c0_g1_i1.p1 TRINITY_DN16488_c0_g1~~TRINITY_DN16488_c0_g1_i1.p1  ORF type:complete len:686 (-),score=80.15 TRINITY_DN16488_c0_g1_i1:205-2208(-)
MAAPKTTNDGDGSTVAGTGTVDGDTPFDLMSFASKASGLSNSREQYANKLEFMLSLVGYAVGLGNVWRFPYLTYTYGGGAFLIPYFAALLLLGLPLFILELGLGQMSRQGTLGVWLKQGLPKLQGVGVAATCCTFAVSLYYNVILGWTIYYIARTFGAMPSGVLPWSDTAEGFSCPPAVVHISKAVAASPYLIDTSTGFINASLSSYLWCGGDGGAPPLDSYAAVTVQPLQCPARAAAVFWESEVLQQSSGMDVLGGFPMGLLLSFTVAWILVYVVIFKGIASSGKVVYVTATLPYLCLIVFFVRAVTLPNASAGLRFFLEPDFSILADPQVWLRAAVQIFYSLGVGSGSLIAFASFNSKSSDFVKDACLVSGINCGTSIFAGFVVFPILGYLAGELSSVNPCFTSDSLEGLKAVGMSGTGLAFIAFPIAINMMPGGFFFALLFFAMLLSLGIDSQFAMVETVVTVLSDAGWSGNLSRPKLSGIVCLVSYLIGLIFVCRGGIYWFSLFDNYCSLLVMFCVTGLECAGLMWTRRGETWLDFKKKVEDWTGRKLNNILTISWSWICPALTFLLCVVNVVPPIGKLDLMGAESSKPYPEGTGFLPSWSIAVGWFIALVPFTGIFVIAKFPNLLTTVERGCEDGKQQSTPCSSNWEDAKKSEVDNDDSVMC